MIKRLTPALLLLVAVLVVLGRVFSREKSDTIGEIEGRRAALKQYAEAALSRRLHDALEAVEPRINQAAQDPLLDADDVLLITSGLRVLPLTPVQPVLGTLDDDDEANQWPLIKRIKEARTDKDVELAVRALLTHRAQWHVPVLHDTETVIAALEHVIPRAHPDLLRGLLRDGLLGQAGLQRRLLHGRTQLDPEIFSGLCEKIAALSRRAGVIADDFEARCKQSTLSDAQLPSFENLPEGPSILSGWYVEKHGDVIRGVRVDVPQERSEIQTQMKQLGMNESADGEKAVERAHSLFRLKLGLLFAIGILGAGVLVLTEMAQRRKRRFLQMREDFVATISHELKTPLASMRVMAETLEQRLQNHPSAKDYPSRLVSEIDGMHALVENILSFNRIDKGRLKPHRVRFALTSMTPVLLDEAQKWPTPVEVSFEGFDDVVLFADAELIQRCVLNLLRNACRYNASNPIKVHLRWTTSTLHIEDNGIGISKADQERVFEDFVRLNPTEIPTQAGTGLGLAICARVMAMHGGRISIERSSSEGTVFAMRFPQGAA